jgi:hypothetical protein
MLSGRIINAIEIGAFVLIVVIVFWLIDKFYYNNSLGKRKYYYFCAILLGVGIHRGLIVGLVHSPSKTPNSGFTISQDIKIESGLDSPFIAPNEDDLEKFPAQLEQSIQKLNPKDKENVLAALRFLAIIIADDIKGDNINDFNKLSEKDFTAKFIVKCYVYAKKNGKNMTLRKYIDLSEEAKKQKPELWRQYQAQEKK